MYLFLMGSSQKIFVFISDLWCKWPMKCLWCFLHASENPIWALARILCPSFPNFKQNKWCFQPLVAILQDYILVFNFIIYFVLKHQPRKWIKTKIVVWTIHEKRPTPLISLQLPAIKVCLQNKIPFCYHLFLS